MDNSAGLGWGSSKSREVERGWAVRGGGGGRDEGLSDSMRFLYKISRFAHFRSLWGLHSGPPVVAPRFCHIACLSISTHSLNMDIITWVEVFSHLQGRYQVTQSMRGG